ncbi:MAG TPA: hypothetical protein VNP73_11815 [Actinomycetota bacterium]|nr:hypothetical protein [Actinomycetota bacterium]
MKRRTVYPLLVMVLLTGTLQAPVRAGMPKTRVVTTEYATPSASVVAAGGGVHACAPAAGGGTANIGCVDIPTKTTERFVLIEAADLTTLPIPMWVGQEGVNTGGYFCGGTGEPIPIAPGVPITIWAFPYTVDPLCQGVSTHGTLTLTFSSGKK